MNKFAHIVCAALCIFSLNTYANSVVLDKHGDYPEYPTPRITAPAQKQRIKHGEYLVKMGDCIACHTDTKNNGKPFAGGLEFKTPFGTLYSPNITPDNETGLGKWDDEDFIRAMREGIHPDGSNYYPAFPFVYFNRLTDDDIKDIKAYIDSVPPINNVPHKNGMYFPFNIRFLQGGWKALFFNFHRGQFKPDPTKSAQWNRGKYIVNGLGHCGMCHSPLNIFGAEETTKYLGGGFIEGYYAPNLTSANLGHDKVRDIVNVFAKDQMLDDAGHVEGPMLEVNHDSLRYLKKDDLEAIAVYLKTVTPIVEKSPAADSGADAGKSIYESKCAVCHNTGAAGAPKLGDDKDWAPRIKLGIDKLEYNAIHGINSMPPKGTCMSCTDQQIKDVVKYMVNNSQPGSAKKAKVYTYTPPKIDTSAKTGKGIYETHCAVCHDSGVEGAPRLDNYGQWKIRARKGVDTLFMHTIHGYKGMPKMGGCDACTKAEVQAAVKYILKHSVKDQDYSLW